MTAPAQAKPASLTPEQRALLSKVGECWGPELIRRLFWLRLPGTSYSQWARDHGFSISLVKAVIAQKRADLDTAPKACAVRATLAEELGLPEDVLFGGSPFHAPSIARVGAESHENRSEGIS